MVAGVAAAVVTAVSCSVDVEEDCERMFAAVASPPSVVVVVAFEWLETRVADEPDTPTTTSAPPSFGCDNDGCDRGFVLRLLWESTSKTMAASSFRRSRTVFVSLVPRPFSTRSTSDKIHSCEQKSTPRAIERNNVLGTRHRPNGRREVFGTIVVMVAHRK